MKLKQILEATDPNQMTEEQQIEYVKLQGHAIQAIKNPSEAVQLAAVKENGYAIQSIDKPSEAVQLAAVQQSGWAITYILNKGIRPSNKVIFAALTHPEALYDNKEYYDQLVMKIFPNNSLLAKKWIRYGDNHRN